MDTAPRVRRSNNDALLAEIVTFCQRAGMAESTFGRRAVNDGKFVPRLRFGGRVTTQTVERVHAFMQDARPRVRADTDLPGSTSPGVAFAAPVVGETNAETRFRFYEHPATVLVMTNMHYAEAPWLRPSTLAAASGLVWHELALRGGTAGQFERQITDLQEFLAQNWTAKISKKSGNPVYERPVVLVIYRDDHRLLLDGVRPKQGTVRADFDLVIASQPYRARAPVEFKASKVIAPLARALGPGGRLVGIHSCGRDVGMEIIQRVWPGESPFVMDRHELLKVTKQVLGAEARGLNFHAYSDQRAYFRYKMHTLPMEISSSIGTSTLLAAWNAAIYVAQIEDERLRAAMADGRYLEATREVLQKHGGLWFQNESYVISRHRFAA